MSAVAAVLMFFGWRVVWAAFVVAVFGWGVGFYGPPVFLHAIHEARGWPVSLVSAAVTCHFLLGAVVVANLAVLHRRFGLVAITRAGALAAALGVTGWALAQEPWQLFADTLLSGFGWAATRAAAINAMVSPLVCPAASGGAQLCLQRRQRGWGRAVAAVGGIDSGLGLFRGGCRGRRRHGAGRLVAVRPVSWPHTGLHGPAAGRRRAGATAPTRSGSGAASLSGSALWRSRRFVTLALATSLGLFAQIGLIAHLFSLLVPALGAQLAGFAAGLATACAIAGHPSRKVTAMHVIERLFCNAMWLLWVGLSVSRQNARTEERPTSLGSSGEACRSPTPDRTILPGW